jgi:sugar-specific transcriptional regulator TrmB|tara:strand:+ start:1460 stop:2167 length:708 start_codon:yes stop_codon:yes gene_type:complete
MDINEKLQKAGLTGNESKVYLELLRGGELNANQVAKSIGMDRTLTYTVINHLIEKGQVNYIIKGGKKFFSCAGLSNLLNSIRSREDIVKELIGELKNVKKKIVSDSKVEVYEGKEGLRTIVKMIIKNKNACFFGATGRAYDYLYETSIWVREWKKKGGSARIITSLKYKGHPMTNIKGMKVKYLDVESEATTSVFGDYVSIHVSIERPLIILIRDKYIAESYRNYFEVLWKVAKK